MGEQTGIASSRHDMDADMVFDCGEGVDRRVPGETSCPVRAESRERHPKPDRPVGAGKLFGAEGPGADDDRQGVGMIVEPDTVGADDRRFRLLSDSDPDPVEIINEEGRTRFVITCEHAGCLIPARLGDLGISETERRRHIGWDIGALDTARGLAQSIGATLVFQTYSRLVIDCNRPPESPESILTSSDDTRIPGNSDIGELERAARRDEIFKPFHDAVERLLHRRRISDQTCPALIALHTFAPVLESEGFERPWDLGLLYNRDRRLADLFDAVLADTDCDFNIAHNEPYTVCDETDYTLPVHGESRGIPNLLLEIRNDHVSDEVGASKWSAFLADILSRVEKGLSD